MPFWRKVLIIVSFILLPAIYAPIAAAAGVSPLVIDVNVNPGDTKEFTISLTPGEEPEKVTFNLYKPIQLASGGLTYEPANESFLPSKWVSLPNNVSTNANGNTEVTGTVKVPFSAGGSYIVIIMVEPSWDQKATGISFRMRYAVRLNIRVSKPGIRAAADIKDFGIGTTEQGEPKITARVVNTSLVDFMTSAEVTIRDANKRLVDRVELKPEIGWSSNLAEARLYPGATVDYFGTPKETLLPGKYDVRLFFRYASGGQLIRDLSIEVKDGDYTYPAFKLKSLRISPLNLEFDGKPGTSANKPIRIENRSSQPLKVEIEEVETQSDYSHSIFKNLEFEVRGERSVIIEPGRSITKIISVRYPKDVAIKDNYGILKIKSSTADGKSPEETDIVLSATISEH